MKSSAEEASSTVSIIVPVYNDEKYLRECLDSLLGQDEASSEILIRDDGSTDRSLDILQDYAARYDRIKLFTGPNKGISWNRNFLMAQASGDYIMISDHDDISCSGRLRKQKAFLDVHPQCVVVGSGYQIIDSGSRPIANYIDFPHTHEQIDSHNLEGHLSLLNTSAMLRKKAALQVGGYRSDFDLAEDLDMYLRLGEIGYLANLPECLVKYRIHMKSASAENLEVQSTAALRACEAAWARRGVSASFKHRDWRMTSERSSRLTFFVRYGWQAWQSGFRESWRHYALQSLKIAPWSPAVWKLLVFGALRRPEQKGGR